MTPAALKSYSLKDLTQLAKQGGVRGWQSMRKDQLVKALLTVTKSKASTNGAKKAAVPARRSPAKATPRATTGRKSAGPTTNGRVVAAKCARAGWQFARAHEQFARHRGQCTRAPASQPGQSQARTLQEPGQRSREGQRPRGQRANRGHGSRPVLVARLLGSEASKRGARAGRDEPELAHGPALSPPAGSFRRGRHQRLGARDPRHRSARRREQLVRARRQLAVELSVGTGLHGRPTTAFIRWSAPTWSPRPSLVPATRSTKTGPTWPRTSTRSTP